MNRVQKLQLDLLGTVRWNALDGRRVARDLDRHRGLWQAAFVTHMNPGGILQALPHGEHYADTLFILPSPGGESELLALARSWEPSEIVWEGLGHHQHFEPIYGEPGRAVLRLWWD